MRLHLSSCSSADFHLRLKVVCLSSTRFVLGCLLLRELSNSEIALRCMARWVWVRICIVCSIEPDMALCWPFCWSQSMINCTEINELLDKQCSNSLACRIGKTVRCESFLSQLDPSIKKIQISAFEYRLASFTILLPCLLIFASIIAKYLTHLEIPIPHTTTQT